MFLLFTAVTVVRVYTDKYEKEFDSVLIFITKYIDKRAPSPCVNVETLIYRLNQKSDWKMG